MDLNTLQTFVEVAERGSFSAAAEILGLPTSTVSRRVGRLEDALGLALVRRQGRAVELTHDGHALAQRARGPLSELAEVEHGFASASGEPRGELSISAPIDFGATPFLTDLVGRYGQAHPSVGVRMSMSNQVVDLLEQNIDVAFRMHAGPLPPRDDLIARRLGSIAFGLYASPTYIEQHPDVVAGDHLAAHPFLAHTTATAPLWPCEPTVRCDDFNPLRNMAAAGTGVAVLPAFLAIDAVTDGTLVSIDLPFPFPDPSLSLVWLRTRHLAPRLRAFIDIVVHASKDAEWLRR